MQKVKLSLFVLLFSLIVPASFAHAGFFGSFADIYTVAAPNSTTAKSTFAYNQQPWLYIKLYNTPVILNNQLTFSGWQNPSAVNIYSTVVNSTSDSLWINLSNWNTVKSPGTWSIVANSLNLSGLSQPLLGSTTFHVNAAPEPLATGLFLMGAFMMGINVLRRKNTIAA